MSIDPCLAQSVLTDAADPLTVMRRVVEQALELTHPGGRVVLTGLPHEASTVNFFGVVRRELRIIGSMIYQEEFPEAIRFLSSGAVTVDRRRAGGRGAWLHPASSCLERALKRKAFARAFKRAVAVDGEALRGQLTGSCRKD